MWNDPNIPFSDCAIIQVIKPSVKSASLTFGRISALDGEIAAVGTRGDFRKVFLYNITLNPAEELAILTSPGTGNDWFGSVDVEVNKKYGVLVGAPLHDTPSIYKRVFFLTYVKST